MHPALNRRRPATVISVALAALAASLLSAPQASAAAVEEYRSPSADTYVSQQYPNSNYGTATTMLVSPSQSVGYIAFDTRIPAGATLTRATLCLTPTATSSTGDRLRVFAVPGAVGWTERGLTWNNQPSRSSTVLVTSAAVVAGQRQCTDLPLSAVDTAGSTDVRLASSNSNRSVRVATREYGGAQGPNLTVGWSTTDPTGPGVGSPPPAGGYFTTLAPGSALPTEAECAARVVRSTWEPRPSNAEENATVPAAGSITLPRDNWGGNPQGEAMKDRVTGNFTGTTDEVMQWAACKWGFSDNHVRATASTESAWHQDDGRNIGFGDYHTTVGMCQARSPIGVHGGNDCPSSFGLLQIKDFGGATGPHEGTYPHSIDSTAFNVDYTLAMRRACFEGLLWIGTASRGDAEGCAGLWFAGDYNTAADDDYLAVWRNHLANRTWLGY